METTALKQTEQFAFIALALLVLLLFVSADRDGLVEERNTLASTLDVLRGEKEQLEDDIQKLQKDKNALIRERSTTPPIVVLSEEQQSYRFKLGSAEVSGPFRTTLQEQIVPLLDSLSEVHGTDVVEVIGHTDSVPVGSRSNLDRSLVTAYESQTGTEVSAGSNVDLGMMRALRIIQLLRSAKSRTVLESIRQFVPYSAGQMVQPNGEVVTLGDPVEDASRRRIEIRLRRMGDYTQAQVN